MERKLSEKLYLNPREFLRNARRDSEMENMLENVYEQVRNKKDSHKEILDWQILNNQYVGFENY